MSMTTSGELQHGSASTYKNHGCRCDDCRIAQRESQRAVLAKLRQRTRDNGGVAPSAVHNYSTYASWGCRCVDCTASNTRESARRRALRAGTSTGEQR